MNIKHTGYKVCTILNSTQYCKPGILFLFLILIFQKYHKHHKQYWKCPLHQSLQIAMFTPFVSSWDTVHQNQFWWMQRMPVQCAWIFSIPNSTLLTVNVATQLELCFICKKHLQNHHATGSQQNWSKAVKWC